MSFNELLPRRLFYGLLGKAAVKGIEFVSPTFDNASLLELFTIINNKMLTFVAICTQTWIREHHIPIYGNAWLALYMKFRKDSLVFSFLALFATRVFNKLWGLTHMLKTLTLTYIKPTLPLFVIIWVFGGTDELHCILFILGITECRFYTDFSCMKIIGRAKGKMVFIVDDWDIVILYFFSFSFHSNLLLKLKI